MTFIYGVVGHSVAVRKITILCIFLRLATKLTIAGGAIYVAYDSGLLGGSEEGSVVLGKAKAAIPPAVDEWMKYFGLEVKKKKAYWIF